MRLGERCSLAWGARWYCSPEGACWGAEVGEMGGWTPGNALSWEEEAGPQGGPPRASGKGSRQLSPLLASQAVNPQLHTLMDGAQVWI